MDSETTIGTIERLGRSIPGVGRSRRRAPAPLWIAAAVVGALAALPLVYLLIVVLESLSDAWAAVNAPRTVELILNTAALAVSVTALSVLVAVPLAWLVVRTDLPYRRVLTALLALPLVIPSYIGAYALISALGPHGLADRALPGFPAEGVASIYGFKGAFLTLTLFNYPFVFLTVRAALGRLNPNLEEAARSLGHSSWSIFFTVSLPRLVPAIAAGGLLVMLYAVHDFGAVSLLRFDTFTTSIYATYKAGFDRVGAAGLAVVLLVLSFCVVFAESRLRGSRSLHTVGVPRPASPVRLGRWKAPAVIWCGLIVTAALLLPISVLVYWSTTSFSGDTGDMDLVTDAFHSLTASGLAAVVAGLVSLPVVVFAVRFPGRMSRALERLAHTGYALPGIVVALALVFFGTRVALPFYQTLPMLVFAYVVLCLPLALGGSRTGIMQVDPALEESARVLGRKPLSVLATVSLPLAARGAIAGAALVFLTAVKELPATLILAPIEYETLAIDIWQATSVGFFERGAVPSLVLIAVSGSGLYLLLAAESARQPWARLKRYFVRTASRDAAS